MSDLPASMGLLAERGARAYGDRLALTGQRSWRFSELAAAIRRVASALGRCGIKPGDRVTLYGENGWHWLVAYHGALRMGAVVNPVNPLLTPNELGHIMSDCGTVAAITSASSAERLASTGRSLINLGYADIEQIVEGGADDTSSTESSGLAAICYTSGTTGRPKGAMQSHRAILTGIALTATMHGKRPGDHVVTALPCAHVYGNVVANAGFVSGAALELHARFEAGAVLDAIEAGATIFEGVPTMYAYLLREALEERDLASLRLCTVGGQTMAVATMEEVEHRLGCPMIELWGMTELAGLGTTHPWTGPRRLGSIGVSLPFVETRIDGAPGGPGELMVRGPVVMTGYFGDPEASKRAVTPDGWLRTGDIVRRDDDGFLFVVDRAKDMILTSGYNVYPAEIERVLAEHHSVSLAAVAGLPDAIKGEIACAWIVLRPNALPDEAALAHHCRERLASYKQPKRFIFVDDLPRNSTGKILRRVLPTTLKESV